MTFCRTYNNGYVVNVLFDLGDGMKWYSLRNFGDRQGDAIAFKEFDCPNLGEAQVKTLIRNYDPQRLYKRIDSRHFKAQTL